MMVELNNVRMLDARKGVARGNPLINALVEQLPAPGEAFPADERAAWLEMMEKAFTMAYGGTRVAPAQKPAAAKKPSARSKARPQAASRKPAPPVTAGPAFFIDRQNIARRRGGHRIMPHDVAGILVDKRGVNGDLATITWADGSTGIPKGLQLDIGIADGED